MAGFSVEVQRPAFKDDANSRQAFRAPNARPSRLAASVSQDRTASRPSPSGGFQPALTRPDTAVQPRGSIDCCFSGELLLLVVKQRQFVPLVFSLVPRCHGL